MTTSDVNARIGNGSGTGSRIITANFTSTVVRRIFNISSWLAAVVGVGQLVQQFLRNCIGPVSHKM